MAPAIHVSTELEDPAPLFSEEWLASEVWPAAEALAALVTTKYAPRVRRAQQVVELGAGTGACGLAAASAGARAVALTDKALALPVLQRNAAANRSLGAIRVFVLEWSCTAERRGLYPELPSGSDLLLAADCLNPIYGEEHARALAATIAALLHRSLRLSDATDPIALVAQTSRGGGEPGKEAGKRMGGEAEGIFLQSAAEFGLVVQRVELLGGVEDAADAGAQEVGHAQIQVFEARPRADWAGYKCV